MDGVWEHLGGEAWAPRLVYMLRFSVGDVDFIYMSIPCIQRESLGGRYWLIIYASYGFLIGTSICQDVV